MTIKMLSIKFDRYVFIAGQPITGCVTVVIVDKPKTINGIRVLLTGKAKFEWTESESYTDSNGESQTRTVIYSGSEEYLDTSIELVSGKTKLLVGEHTYPFSASLPAEAPATFTGQHGRIAYCGIVKISIPFSFDKTQHAFFQVENLLDLNQLPKLKYPSANENSKRFCCCCCATAPLTIILHVPKSGYAKTESIPFTMEVDNASNVAVDAVMNVVWKAVGNSTTTKDAIKTLTFGAVPAHATKTWSERMTLDCGPFPNISNSRRLLLTYTLEVMAKPSGAHIALAVAVPITIGDISFRLEGDELPPRYPGLPSVAANSSPFSASNPVRHYARRCCVVS